MPISLGDVSTEVGLKALNDHLANQSYIDGYAPSQADLNVIAVARLPDSTKFPNARRWFNHILSFSDRERAAFRPSAAVVQLGSGTASAPSPVPPKAAPKAAAKPADDDDDDVDLFGSDDEVDEEAEKAKAERVAAYAAKKAKKPALIAKSSVILDVKPWDDETDMKAMETSVRGIEMDGLLWKASKLVPLAYGINKLQIMCVVEDDKVSVDLLQEKIEELEDLVQSVDIAAFQKI